MSDSERYCQRCGDDAWSFYACNGCLSEFCDSCGTPREIMEHLCERCVGEHEQAMRRDEHEIYLAHHVMPAMREWYRKNVMQAG